MDHQEHHIPTKYNPDGRQLKRHHMARYYMHRVQESLTTRVSKLVCSVCLSLLFISWLIAFILWLSLRPHRPRFHVREFSMLSLALEDGFRNAQITFNVTVRNPNLNIGIHYDAMDATIYYEDQSIGSIVLLYPFYQSPKNTTILYETLNGPQLLVNNARWAQFLYDRTRGTVSFRLDIASTIRFKVSTWDSRRHKMHANCQVHIGPDGLLLPSYKEKRCPLYFT